MSFVILYTESIIGRKNRRDKECLYFLGEGIVGSRYSCTPFCHSCESENLFESGVIPAFKVSCHSRGGGNLVKRDSTLKMPDQVGHDTGIWPFLFFSSPVILAYARICWGGLFCHSERSEESIHHGRPNMDSSGDKPHSE